MRIDQAESNNQQATQSLIILKEAVFCGEALRTYLTSWRLFQSVSIAQDLGELYSQLRMTPEPIVLLTEIHHELSIEELITMIRTWGALNGIIVSVTKDTMASLADLLKGNPEGIINFDEENKRLEREAAKLKKDIKFISGKLSNPKFVDKAPPEIVQKERDKLSVIEGKLAKLQENINRIASLQTS